MFNLLRFYSFIYSFIHLFIHLFPLQLHVDLRWLDWISYGQYLPSLSINYVAINNDIEKRSPLLYYIKMKICYD